MKYASILIILLFVCVSPLLAINTDGLVLYLPFDEGSGNMAGDVSGTGNDGEIMGNVTWVDGVFGKAVQIGDDDPGNMVVVPDNDTLDIIGAMTISMWVNIQTVPDGSCSTITKADTYMIHISDWSGNGIEQELLLWPFDAWQTPASTPIQLEEWRHVTGVYDGSMIRMYIDGEMMGERERTGDTDITENDLVIGRDSRGCCNTRVAAMTVDEVMMWNRALSDDEVMESMSSMTAVEPFDHLTSTWGQIKKY
ncbi:hypothetical protein GF312_06605 [Candidatus Poribacteria bacterium]|nr:hypothetical protein [Candidatus Poribacteria bacterium]